MDEAMIGVMVIYVDDFPWKYFLVWNFLLNKVILTIFKHCKDLFNIL